ncbi:chaperone protein dnaJ 49-like [Vigna umbellata]|uniref:chaperone protein dnaJ 49-like n=1 Tax=Vigna umbellata TaxID=87088 RepID=UPI001F5E9E92|nr:chaperone protein dnaJ 49-like [Vigna umbellata]XP_047155696.1 chaperone protein dnaJ 49-like [Vigna umbellata]
MMSHANYTENDVRLIREIEGKSDYYAILGLEKSCSVEEIRKAYRELSLKVHPEKNKARGSQDAFNKISEAYKSLKDAHSRSTHDQTNGPRQRRTSPPPRPNSPPPRPNSPPPRPSGMENPKRSQVNDFVLLVLLLPLLMVILVACSPFLSRVFLALI